MPRPLTVALLAASLMSAAGAQTAPRYKISADTLRYEMDNPFRMYWVKGADTVGSPQREHSVESHVWRGDATKPEVVIRQILLNVNRRVVQDTFGLAPDGRVSEINHRPTKGAQRIDLLLQLPASPLAVGTAWTDSVRATGSDPAGAEWYEVVRSYRVVRMLDTLGSRGVASVSANGSIKMRFGFWTDSATGKAAWIDVTGPVREEYLFDVAKGRLLRRYWTMDLRGTGVSPAGSDTVQAGLTSNEELVLSSAPRTRFLLQPLPGADTSITFNIENQGTILLHTVARESGRVTSSLVRNDGLVGVATVQIANGSVTAYSATWADSAGMSLRALSGRGGAIVLQQSGKRDTSITLPTQGSWGVADYAMQELLAPILLAVPRDSAPHPFAVFRPYSAHWDSGTVVSRERGDAVLVVLKFGEKNDPEVVLLSTEGDYLYGENSGPVKARRVPVNAARQAQLKATILKMKAGGQT